MERTIDYLPGEVAVIGGGRMGTGIAHAFLIKGSNVRLVEASSSIAEAAAAKVRELLAASIERKVLDGSVGEIIARLTVHTSIDEILGCQLVVEAVPEDLDLKANVLKRADQVLDEDAILGTNTSSMSIDELATFTSRPHQLLGLHFFNPVPASLLVEVVKGRATRENVVEQSRIWVDALGKTPVIVGDSPGFASSRLGLALGLEAIRMVEEGVASPKDIDLAMTLGNKHPIGPLRLTDVVGLDVRLGIAEYLFKKLGPRFEPPALLRLMVEQGSLGQK
ncbi:MAG: 3-hydroxyacyl-CoA dehydrogenase family protein, partial [Acidimicrobiales bacterium]